LQNVFKSEAASHPMDRRSVLLWSSICNDPSNSTNYHLCNPHDEYRVSSVANHIVRRALVVSFSYPSSIALLPLNELGGRFVALALERAGILVTRCVNSTKGQLQDFLESQKSLQRFDFLFIPGHGCYVGRQISIQCHNGEMILLNTILNAMAECGQVKDSPIAAFSDGAPFLSVRPRF
jgi:hypothetical protein